MSESEQIVSRTSLWSIIEESPGEGGILEAINLCKISLSGFRQKRALRNECHKELVNKCHNICPVKICRGDMCCPPVSNTLCGT